MNQCNASPVRSPIRKNNTNVKNVAHKSDANTTGSQTLFKVDQIYHKFHCPTKNRFALLTPSFEGQESTDVSVSESRLQSSGKDTKTMQSNQYMVTKATLWVGSPNYFNKVVKIIVNTLGRIVKNMPKNDVLDNKYDLALQTKNKNKIKMKQTSEDPTFQQWDQQNESKFGFIPLGPSTIR